MRRLLDRHLSKMVVAIGCLAMAAQTAAAQAKASYFSAGYTDIGPTLGIGNLGSASASFGGRFEHAIKPLPRKLMFCDEIRWSIEIFLMIPFPFHNSTPFFDPKMLRS